MKEQAKFKIFDNYYYILKLHLFGHFFINSKFEFISSIYI